MRVEVVFALPRDQDIVTVELPERSTAAQAVEASRLHERHALSIGSLRLAIFGKLVAASRQLRTGDRVEILRDLALEPNAARRGRAARSRRR